MPYNEFALSCASFSGVRGLAFMTTVHPSIEVYAAFRTMHAVPNPSALEGVARIEDISKCSPDAKYEIRVARLDQVGLPRVIKALRDSRVRICRFFLSPHYLADFWKSPSEDCVGGLLGSDGGVALPDATLNWRIVPLSEPLYTIGRPEADSEHSRFKPHVLGHEGGIPIVSDEFLGTLRKLGATGDTGTIIYRGINKAAYDTVQAGFKRFLIRPEYEMPYAGGLEFLPEEVPEDFGICCMRRVHKGGPREIRIPGIKRNIAEDTWYDIALSAVLCGEILRLRRKVILDPLFRRNGATYRWVAELETAVEALKE
jgi:hypothetical protein